MKAYLTYHCNASYLMNRLVKITRFIDKNKTICNFKYLKINTVRNQGIFTCLSNIHNRTLL